jgi:hypothetical protein
MIVAIAGLPSATAIDQFILALPECQPPRAARPANSRLFAL